MTKYTYQFNGYRITGVKGEYFVTVDYLRNDRCGNRRVKAVLFCQSNADPLPDRFTTCAYSFQAPYSDDKRNAEFIVEFHERREAKREKDAQRNI